MSVWLAMLLGLVQGLCEFLPVSSSGHLVLLQTVFGIEEGVVFFDTMLHVGTLFAVVAVFYKEIWAMIRKPVQRKVGMLLIATAVTGVIGIAFKDFFEGAFSGGLLGVGFILTCVILLITDRFPVGHKTTSRMRPLDAVGVGLMQGVAMLPGISRSGATIAGSRFCGLTKQDAAEFSFLLSIPAILGSLVLQVPDVIKSGTGGIGWGAVIAGMLVAAVSGYFAVRFMIRIITKKKMRGFAIYVGILGLLVLLDQFAFNLFFANPFA